ncbi:PQQ-dependent sugar dehydrogenase [Aurantiacibacter sp. MUD11]|uniref:PQQ-dependent sugar dehydrogenase n=1 Tax=Aurantiacibacter sp. MUD11 TaxID=3003265 RepID=UPI0022AAC8F2|nr:PQQ-dependent sugar dehydrogenase [Aurantiacibacter sp. MUD11]WAT18010.1 PQQ-dependent sugar dehydrogenase [Aurantiacibacter sp. MUD11]
MRNWLLAGTLLMVAGAASAQQPPPPGIATPVLPDSPQVYDTAEQHGIAVTVLARDFERPFAIDFLPNGDMLIVERGVGLRLLRGATGDNPVLEDGHIAGVPIDTPEVFSYGVIDIALHPDFAENGWIYFTVNEARPLPEGTSPLQRPGRFQVMRGTWADGAVSNVEIILEAEGDAYAGGNRVHVADDGMVWVATTGPYDGTAQDLTDIYGKVLRLNTDGSIPADNPFVGTEGVHPAIYSYGHRDQHGLTVHPETGEAWSVEHGPNGGDEANLIQPGGNYGWPDYSFGREYDGSDATPLPFGPGTVEPRVVWLPSIAPSGLLFYTGEAFPAWQGNLFIGSARWGEINHTGSLQRVVFNEDFGELRREALLSQLHHRVRDVAQGPDGNIYVLSDGPTNAVLRISPAELP